MLPVTGKLSTSESTLYTVPVGITCALKWLQAVTVTSGSVQFWLTARGTKSAITPPVAITPGSLMNVLEGTELRMSMGNSISGKSSVVDTDYLIAGTEEKHEGYK
jgi:hypothetical protein